MATGDFSLRRSCEKASSPPCYIYETAFKVKNVSSVSVIERSPISCAVPSLVKTISVWELLECRVKKQHFEMPQSFLSQFLHSVMLSCYVTRTVSSTERSNRQIRNRVHFFLVFPLYFNVKYCTVPTVFVFVRAESHSSVICDGEMSYRFLCFQFSARGGGKSI